jgi:hypothetical protein
MPVLLNLCSEINLQPLGNRIGDVMVSVFTLNAVDHVFEARSSLTKDCNSGICCSFAKHTALWSMESELKQQSVGRHVAPLGHIIMIPSQSVFPITP